MIFVGVCSARLAESRPRRGPGEMRAKAPTAAGVRLRHGYGIIVMSDFDRRTFFTLLGAGAFSVVLAPAAQAEVVIYERVMPELRVEAPPPPRSGFFWVPGHWVWRGGWAWVPGHWVRHGRPMPPPIVEVVPVRPAPTYFWVRGHWVWSDRRADWLWVRGHWVR